MMRIKVLLVFAILILVSLGLIKYISFKSPATSTKPRIKIGNVEVFVDIAKTNVEKARGLSGKKSLRQNEGMLFLFEDDTYPAFWMKDMLIPIDIIWIADSKVVYINENVPAPESGTSDSQLPLYTPPTGVDYVLEVSAGFSSKNGVKVGDDVELPK